MKDFFANCFGFCYFCAWNRLLLQSYLLKMLKKKKDFLNEIEFSIFCQNEFEIKSISLFNDVGLNETFNLYSTKHKSSNPLTKRCLLTNRRCIPLKGFSMAKPIFKKTMANHLLCGLKRAV